MNQYEDLKNFREKTQLKSLRFVDFTKQNREVSYKQWSIVNQMTDGGEEQTQPVFPQHQAMPVEPDTFLTPPSQTVPAAPFSPVDTTQQPSVGKPASPLSRFTSVLPEVTPSAAPATPSPRQSPSSETAGNFTHLFTHQPAAEPESITLDKNTPLQPLLKRIALCR